MAGKNHFSMLARISKSINQITLAFESACLVQQELVDVFLGTTYKIADGFCLGDGDGGLDKTSIKTLRIVSEDVKDDVVASVTVPDASLLQVESDRQFSVAAPHIQSGEPTQWSYSICLWKA